MLVLSTIVLALITIGMFFIASTDVGARGGPDVAMRFLERSWSIPSPEMLNNWLMNTADNGAAVKYYARVMMPVDILFSVTFGAFLLIGSLALVTFFPFGGALAEIVYYLFWFLPIIYTTSDLAEDVMIMILLYQPMKGTQKDVYYGFWFMSLLDQPMKGTQKQSPEQVEAAGRFLTLFGSLRIATWIKLRSGVLAFFQISLLAFFAIAYHPNFEDCPFAGVLPRCDSFAPGGLGSAVEGFTR
jgi:hypothetical protein